MMTASSEQGLAKAELDLLAPWVPRPVSAPAPPVRNQAAQNNSSTFLLYVENCSFLKGAQGKNLGLLLPRLCPSSFAEWLWPLWLPSLCPGPAPQASSLPTHTVSLPPASPSSPCVPRPPLLRAPGVSVWGDPLARAGSAVAGASG